jgi:predicted esterase
MRQGVRIEVMRGMSAGDGVTRRCADETPANPPRAWFALAAAVCIGAAMSIGSCAAPRSTKGLPDRAERVGARPDDGFHWPYYVYVGEATTRRAHAGAPIRLLVLPNNTGTSEADFDTDERQARRLLRSGRSLADELDLALLVPVFPRPASEWRIYTHALDRDTLTTDLEELARPDLQLLAMIDDARRRWGEEGIEVGARIVIMGFSASGMFANRFTLLHPDRVAVAVVGSPGGWPAAPVASWAGRPLRYPVGVADVGPLAGSAFDVASYRAVPHLFFLGDEDDNDSVPYDDGYEDEDERLIFALFGPTPVSRWPAAQAVYESIGADAQFRLYKGVGHELTDEMMADIVTFIRAALDRGH